jgi:hypothetical protein
MTFTEVISVLESRGCKPKKSGNGWMALCPAHCDGTPSLSVAEGRDGRVLVKCFANCPMSEVVVALGLKVSDLFPPGSEVPRRPRHQARGTAPTPTPRTQHEKPPLEIEGLEIGTSEDRDRLAALRGLPREAIDLAVSRNVLRFGDYDFRGVESCVRVWSVTDESRRALQLRRLDGQPCRWITRGSENCSKSFTFRGSNARWPVGLSQHSGGTPLVLLLEGGPDLLAAYAILAQHHRCAKVIPAAMLGGSTSIDPHALDLLRGCHVRIVPHVDPTGFRAEDRWAEQLMACGATVDVFDLSDKLLKGKDLNDFVRSAPSHRWKEVVS